MEGNKRLIHYNLTYPIDLVARLNSSQLEVNDKRIVRSLDLTRPNLEYITRWTQQGLIWSTQTRLVGLNRVQSGVHNKSLARLNSSQLEVNDKRIVFFFSFLNSTRANLEYITHRTQQVSIWSTQ